MGKINVRIAFRNKFNFYWEYKYLGMLKPGITNVHRKCFFKLFTTFYFPYECNVFLLAISMPSDIT